jgi:hypothetical protein
MPLKSDSASLNIVFPKSFCKHGAQGFGREKINFS